MKKIGHIILIIFALFILNTSILQVTASSFMTQIIFEDGQPEEIRAHIHDSIVQNTRPLTIERSRSQVVINTEKIYSTTNYRSHMLTESEVLELKERIGVFDPTTNYNTIINGLGTGLAPPAEEDWEAMIGTIEVVDAVVNGNLPSFVDHSQSVYFPQVRSQGSQASCSAWMTTYYAHGFYQAREFGWTQASTGNNNQLLNPGWTYNKVNKGYDKGSSVWRNWKVLNTIGAVRWSTMPFDSKEDIAWGTENAWREAPLYRAGNYKQTDVKNIDVVRAWVDDGFICSISIDSSQYDGLGVGDDTITSQEYNSTIHNHANAVVGYDDNKVVAGERGAFKIVNSWGSDWGDINGGRNNLGGWNGYGYYWMTYQAFTELVRPVYMFYDKVDYDPSLLATWSFQGNCSRDAALWLYLGSTSAPDAQRELYCNAGKHNYPDFLCLDVSEFYDFASLKPVLLKINSGTNNTNISSFKLELYETSYSTDNSTATLISPESRDVPILTPCTIENILAGHHVKIISPLDNNYYKSNIMASGSTNYSITHTILSEDFEEEFPGQWVVGDYNSSYGEDYWGNTSYRSKSGFSSAWCAEVAEPIFQEDFDTGGPLPPGWTTYSENTTTSQPWEMNNTGYDFVYGGDDYAAVCNSSAAGVGTNITEWLFTTTGFNASSYSYLSLQFLIAYDHYNGDEFAEVLYANESTYPNFTSLKVWTVDTYGHQRLDLSAAAGSDKVYLAFKYHGTFDRFMLIDDVRVITNSTSNEYDHDMMAYMYQPVNLSNYDVVNLTYDYWINSENLIDFLKIMYYYSGSWYFLTVHTGTSSGWRSNSVIIPNNAEHIGFQFESDNLTSGFEGAYIDNVNLTGTINLSLAEVRIDTGAWNPAQGTTSWRYALDTRSYSDGVHTLTVRGRYGAFDSIDFVDFIVDNSPPEPFMPAVNPGNWTSNKQPVLTFETSDETSYIEHYEVKLDSGGFTTRSSPYMLPVQTEGTHLVTVRAFDALGHFRDGNVNYFIDATPPSGFEPTAEPGNWTNNPQPVITFTTSDTMSGVQRYMLKIDEGNFTNQTSPFTLPSQTDGIHTITVQAFDQAENFVEGNVNVYIDTHPPENLTITSKSTGWTKDNTPRLTFMAT
ncbi:OmpL47-type beta-barrel domain-containing protein, partial [[Eubacterium] cellulosolvens]